MSPTGYKGFYCFENYWQSGKIYEGTDREKTLGWWKSQIYGKRRFPQGKGKRILGAKYFDRIDTLDYIEARKKVYLPEYWNLVKDTNSIKILISLIEKGESIVLYGFDGPRDRDGNPLCIEASLDFLKNKLNDETHPFGHGYIISAIIQGFLQETLLS